MKTPHDPRHIHRQKLVQELFQYDFHEKQPVSDTIHAIMDQQNLVDSYITRAAPEFPIDKINKVDLAILRLAVYELLIDAKEPAHVIIDEAIELAKEFSGDTSPAFVNGALGKIATYEKPSNIQK